MKKSLFLVHCFAAGAAAAAPAVALASIPFRRVAKSGPTSDGREIKAEWLEQAAATYDPALYGARINCEHWRGMNPNGDFGSYGDVIALKTEKAADGATVLLAQLQPNDKAKAINAAGQKVYTSIEIAENFAGTGQAYLVGLALTDSPASLNTERLTFSKMGEMTKAQAFAAPDAIDLSEAEPAESWAAGLRKFVTDKFAALGKSHDKGIAGVQEAVGGIVTDLTEQFTKRAQADAERIDQLTAEVTALKSQLGSQAEDFKQLKSSLDGKPANEFKQRPASTGGAGQQLTEF